MNDEFDRELSEEPAIDPSPAFVRSVMAAVERESAGPPPLAFPWLRAAPIALAALGVLAFIVYTAWSGLSGAPLPSLNPSTASPLRPASTPVAIAIAVGLLASAASVAVATLRMER
jgi:hypothetical protein